MRRLVVAGVAGRGGGRWSPAPSVYGFVLLLVVLLGVSWGAGHLAGPVAPGMRENSTGGGSGEGDHGGGSHGLAPAAWPGAGR